MLNFITVNNERGDKYVRVNVNHIVRYESYGKCSIIYLTGDKSFRSLNTVEEIDKYIENLYKREKENVTETNSN